ncbi:MAG TPA: hypothetical protein VGS27_17035 [Candidatus Sulfotelmatobacter sp.]|nr:hypothetical protein [Candidatus Sulfotelmatobacter sp.]
MLAAGGMMGGFGSGGMMGRARGQYGMDHLQGMGDWMWGRGVHPFGMSSPWFGLVAGLVVLIGAVMLYVNPEQRRNWGLVILVISALNIFVGIGGILAGAFGVVGGALAIAAKI